MFTFITLNVRGLRNKTKRTSIFRWLKREKADFYLIQEAYCLDTDLEEWKKEWGGEMYINCCTNHSKGLLILVSPYLNSKLNHIVKDVNCTFYILMLQLMRLSIIFGIFMARTKTMKKLIS